MRSRARALAALDTKSKLLLAYAAASLGVLALLSGIYFHYEREVARVSLEERGRALAGSLASAASGPLASRDHERLRVLLHEALEREPDAVRLVLTERSGRTLADERDPARGGADFEIEAPIRFHGRPLGTVRAAFSLRRTERQLVRFLGFLALVGGLIFALATLGFSRLIDRGVVRPLLGLTKAARALGQGRSVALPDMGHGELAVLAHAFETTREQLRRSHEALEASKRFLEEVLEALPQPVLVACGERVEMANPAARALFDSAAGSLRSRRVAALFHSEQQACALWREVRSNGEVHGRRYEVMAAGGAPVPVSVSARRIGCEPGDDGEQAARVVFALVDLRETERLVAQAARAELERERADELERLAAELERALEAAAAAETYSRTIVETAAHGIVVLAPDGRIERVNRAAARMFGRGATALAGRPVAALLADGEAGEGGEAGALERVREAAEHERDLLCCDATGRRFPAEVRCSSMTIGGRRLEVVWLRDLTEVRAREAELAALQRRWLDASRKAGMAEVASAILHNVGNVLNSINVSASTLAESIRRSRIGSVGKLAALLAEHGDDLGRFFSEDPRAAQVAPFLQQLARALEAERTGWLDETAVLQRHLEHVKRVIAHQQRRARTGAFDEVLDLAEVCDAAIEIALSSSGRCGIEVVRNYDAIGPVLADRHRLLEVLINLVTNARQAIERHDGPRRTVTVEVAQREEGGQPVVAISVADTGCGIAAELRERIFSHGFTTREDGNGFGLHASANIATELGGSLRCESDGPGCGARFTLAFPLRRPDEHRPGVVAA